MEIQSNTRRANFRLFLGLVIFAFVLCMACLLWMRVKVRENGGVVDPHYASPASYEHRPVAPARPVVLPVSQPLAA